MSRTPSSLLAIERTWLQGSKGRPSLYHKVPIGVPARRFSERPRQRLCFSSVGTGSGRFAPDAASQIPPNCSLRRSPCPIPVSPGPIPVRYALLRTRTVPEQPGTCPAPTAARRLPAAGSNLGGMMSPASLVREARRPRREHPPASREPLPPRPARPPSRPPADPAPRAHPSRAAMTTTPPNRCGEDMSTPQKCLPTRHYPQTTSDDRRSARAGPLR